VTRSASNDWVLLTADVQIFASLPENSERIKLISANLQRHYSAVTETSNDVYYWCSYWDRDPNYPMLEQIAEESKAAGTQENYEDGLTLIVSKVAKARFSQSEIKSAYPLSSLKPINFIDMK